MTKTFTKHDVLDFVLGEASKTTSEQIHIAQLENDSLAEQIDEYRAVEEELGELVIKAPKSSVDRILEYSNSNSLESA